jgi:3-oxoacyl-(acyl-carrier-protein) synthase
MLLLSSTGPIKTPVGACAMSLEVKSLDTGCDLIASGKAKLCLVGGYDGISQEIATGFSKMMATVDPSKEISSGQLPSEMSRPLTSTRTGFVEAEGAGVQILISARLGIEMGLPIYAVVAFTGTAADGPGMSIPAPGKGVLGICSRKVIWIVMVWSLQWPQPTSCSLLGIGLRVSDTGHYYYLCCWTNLWEEVGQDENAAIT